MKILLVWTVLGAWLLTVASAVGVLGFIAIKQFEVLTRHDKLSPLAAPIEGPQRPQLGANRQVDHGPLVSRTPWGLDQRAIANHAAILAQQTGPCNPAAALSDWLNLTGAVRTNI